MTPRPPSTRVLHVVVAGEIGGAERMLCDLASRPDATGADHAVALLTPSHELEGILRTAGLRVFVRAGVREGPVRFLWRSLGPVDVAWVARVADTHGAEIVHLHTFASQVLGTRAARRMGARVVRTEHSTRVYDDPSCWPFSRWSLARSDAVVAISEHVRGAAIARAAWAAPRLRVVWNGVDIERFTPLPWPDTPVLVLAMVGRLDGRKGIDRALRAVASVPDVHLEVVGEGVERAKLETLARDLGLGARVRFHGRLADPRPILALAHAFVTTSRKEGLGIANLEAMAAERPVIGLPTGGVKEIVEDGVTGLFARSDELADLVELIHRARNDRGRLHELGRAARRFVVDRASVTEMCRGYARVYADVTEGVRPRRSPPRAR